MSLVPPPPTPDYTTPHVRGMDRIIHNPNGAYGLGKDVDVHDDVATNLFLWLHCS